jgi:MFS transporter, ACS family, D-galactonate transporter
MQEGAEVPRGRGAMTRVRWGIVGMAFLGTTINYVDRAILAIALLSLSYGSLTFANASVWSLPADLAPTQGHTASLAGLMNFAGNAAGVAVSTSVGALLALTGGSYVLPVLSAFGFAILGALVYLFVIRRVAPLEARPTPQTSGEPTS